HHAPHTAPHITLSLHDALPISARDPDEHRLMADLVEHRGVAVEGNMEPHLEWIKTAAEGKSCRGTYGKGYELLISVEDGWFDAEDRKSTRLNSSHGSISYAVFC